VRDAEWIIEDKRQMNAGDFVQIQSHSLRQGFTNSGVCGGAAQNAGRQRQRCKMSAIAQLIMTDTP
jgi:hypothetical protein